MLCQTNAERGDADGRPIVFEVGADRFAIDYAITELNQKTGAQRCGLPYRPSTITRKKTWHRSQPPSQQFRKVIGHRQIPLLLSSMANAVSKKPIVKGAAVA